MIKEQIKSFDRALELLSRETKRGKPPSAGSATRLLIQNLELQKKKWNPKVLDVYSRWFQGKKIDAQVKEITGKSLEELGTLPCVICVGFNLSSQRFRKSSSGAITKEIAPSGWTSLSCPHKLKPGGTPYGERRCGNNNHVLGSTNVIVPGHSWIIVKEKQEKENWWEFVINPQESIITTLCLGCLAPLCTYCCCHVKKEQSLGGSSCCLSTKEREKLTCYRCGFVGCKGLECKNCGLCLQQSELGCPYCSARRLQASKLKKILSGKGRPKSNYIPLYRLGMTGPRRSGLYPDKMLKGSRNLFPLESPEFLKPKRLPVRPPAGFRLGLAAIEHYLLAGIPDPSPQLKAYKEHFSLVFSSYLLWALVYGIFRELRHTPAKATPGRLGSRKILGEVLSQFPDRESTADAEKAYEVIQGMSEFRLSKNLLLAEEIFGWYWRSSSFGGVTWATIAKTCREYLERKISRTQFVEFAISSEHNGGCALNKDARVSAESSYFIEILNAKATLSYEKFLKTTNSYIAIETRKILKREGVKV